MRKSFGHAAILSLATAALLAAQEPLAGPGAQKLSAVQFVLITQVALLVAAPFLLIEREARRDFKAILTSAAGWRHLAALTAVGIVGLALYNLCLRHAHPVVVTSILNLSPFWAAMVARTVVGVRIPAGPLAFALSLIGAFAGAMIVAYSQIKGLALSRSSVLEALGKGSWYFAIPVPIFTALSATLVGLWFNKFRESASIAAALVTPPLALAPACVIYLWMHGQSLAPDWRVAVMLMAAAVLANAIGRLFYQLALTSADYDNGFVSMFFLLAPGLAGLYSWLLSRWVQSLRFEPNFAYFVGLIVTAASLLYFMRTTRSA